MNAREKLSPSRLFCEAYGLQPVGPETATLAGQVCVTCGVEIALGAPVRLAQDRVETPSFNNRRHLADRRSPYICGHCEASWDTAYRRPPFANSMTTREGVFSMSRRQDIAWFMVHPPAPPFMMQWTVGKNQCMIWRGVVSWDDELLQIRMGDDVGTIRRSVVLKAHQRVLAVARAFADDLHRKRMADFENAGGAVRGRKAPEPQEPMKHIFRSLEYKMKATEPRASGHGILMPSVALFLQESGASEDLDLFGSLTVAEGWALGALLKQPVGELVAPEEARVWMARKAAEKVSGAAVETSGEGGAEGIVADEGNH
jgi:CRISPR type IV-associated protein Csf1